MADYYPMGEASFDDNSTTATPENSMPQDDKEKMEESDETALVPNSFFGDKPPEVGHVCRIKVVHVYEDETEVEYMDQEKGEDTSSKDEMSNSMDSLNSMADRNSSAY